VTSLDRIMVKSFRLEEQSYEVRIKSSLQSHHLSHSSHHGWMNDTSCVLIECACAGRLCI